MVNDDYLDGLEKKIYGATNCDGLTDIFCGLMFIAAGAIRAFESIGVSRFLTVAVFFPLVILIYQAGRIYIIRPRIGVVRLGSKRKMSLSRLRYVYWIIAIVSVTLITITVSGVLNEIWVGYYKSGVLGAYIFLSLGLTAYFIEFRRLYVLAILGGAAFPLNTYFNNQCGDVMSPILLFGIPGLGFAIYGVRQLQKFIRENPPFEEVEGAG